MRRLPRRARRIGQKAGAGRGGRRDPIEPREGKQAKCAESSDMSAAGPCRQILFAGLQRLEYRGYDSAGLALQDDGHIESVRAVGNLSALQRALAAHAAAHDGTRNATASWPRPRPSRPRASATRAGRRTEALPGRTPIPTRTPHGRVHIVLNGIIENHLALRDGWPPPGPSSAQTQTPRSSRT